MRKIVLKLILLNDFPLNIDIILRNYLKITMSNKRSVPQKLDKLTRNFLAMLRDSPDSVDLKEVSPSQDDL